MVITQPNGWVFSIRVDGFAVPLMNCNERLIQLEGINKSYQVEGRQLYVLDDVDLYINKGERCAVLGTSGSGKSTLLNVLGLLDLPDSGTYKFAGVNVFASGPDQLAALRNQKIGFVFQNFNLIPRLTAVENVAVALTYRGIRRREALRRAMIMLQQVGLAGRAYQVPADLSGGQRQRVALARALVGEPSLILADEPTGNLDSDTAEDIMALLLSINRQYHTTLVVVTHDLAIARRLDRQIHVDNGRVSNGAPCFA